MTITTASDSQSPRQIDVLTLTATSAAAQLTSGQITSEALVLAYLAQIDKHNHTGVRLNALISLRPREALLDSARALDVERENGRMRGPLHGVPFVVKDVFLTHPDLGMPTTAGAPCFLNAKAKRTSPLIQHLLDSGLILLGKTNLTIFCGMKDYENNTPGWSPVGGQTQNPYIYGGLEPGEKPIGNSIPGGSSSGSAVCVAAGFAPLAIGTECNGSVINPAGRNALYALKINPDGVNADAAFRFTTAFDCVGAMAKSAQDVNLLTAAMMERVGGEPFVVEDQFNGLRIGWLNRETWSLPEEWCAWPGNSRKDMEKAYASTRTTLTKAGAKVISIELQDATEALKFDDGKSGIHYIGSYQMITTFFPKFLAELTNSPVHSIQDIIQYNEDHADICLPLDHPTQREYHDLATLTHTSAESERRRISMHERSHGNLAPIFAQCDVIVAWADSQLVSYASTARYPVACVPMAMLRYSAVNARPFGLAVMAKEEATLLHFMAAYERVVPPRALPGPLVEGLE